MACNAPRQEWTIETRIDGHPEPEKGVIVFCINIENGKITGEVSDLTTGTPVPLSPVTGSSQPLPELGPEITVMTLIFKWGTSRVVLSGTTFHTGVTNKFRGGFAAFRAPVVDGALSPDEGLADEPGDGDTGTGTGTQT